MATYKEQLKNRYYYVLTEKNIPLATFGNLKKVSDYLEDEGKDFYKYNTLVRKEEFPVERGDLKVYKVKHH